MMPSRRLLRAIFVAASILAAIPIAWYWLDASVGVSRFAISVLVGHVAAVAALGIGVALAWKGWHASGAPALGLFLLAFGVYNGSVALIQALRILFPNVGAPIYDLVLAVAVGGGLGSLIRFSAFFPVPHGTMKRAYPTVTRKWRLLGRLRSVSGSLTATLLGASIIAGVLTVDGLLIQPDSYIGPRQSLIQLFMAVGFSIACLNLGAAYAHLGEHDRRKVFWVAEGVLLLGLGVAVPLGLSLTISAVGGELPRTFEWYALVVSEIAFVACLAFAVFGRGAMDSALLFRRTTVAGGTAILALFLFSGIENLVTEFIVASLGLPAAVGTWIAGGLVALAFTPLYRWADKKKGSDSTYVSRSIP